MTQREGPNDAKNELTAAKENNKEIEPVKNPVEKASAESLKSREGLVEQQRREMSEQKNPERKPRDTTRAFGKPEITGDNNEILVKGVRTTENRHDGKDKVRTDERSQAERSGFTGMLQSPDGKDSLRVSGGNCFDKDDRLVGNLNSDGRFLPATGQSNRIDINSRFEGWKFEGAEDGRQRVFECKSNLASGEVLRAGSERQDNRIPGPSRNVD